MTARSTGKPWPSSCASTSRSRAAIQAGKLPEGMPPAEELLAGVRAALLANPLLDGDRLLVVKRDFPGGTARQVGVGRAPGSSLPTTCRTPAWPPGAAGTTRSRCSRDLRGKPRLQTLHRSKETRILRDVRLDFDAEKTAVFQHRRKRALGRLRDSSRRRRGTPADSVDVSGRGLLRRLLSARRTGHRGLDRQLPGRALPGRKPAGRAALPARPRDAANCGN